MEASWDPDPCPRGILFTRAHEPIRSPMSVPRHHLFLASPLFLPLTHQGKSRPWPDGWEVCQGS